MEAKLRFFRATPKSGPLAQRLGRVPIVQLVVFTDEGLHQSMEFIGVHQRQYCAEEPPSDAISEYLVESLLKVVLEFVFHPSRTRYARERLVLKECSSSEEARKCRTALLPRMVQEVRKTNDKIKEVSIELCDSQEPSSDPAGSKERSFLVLDEDVLKVAPSKSSTCSPPAAGAFKGLGQGFLNSSSAKRRGLSSRTASQPSLHDRPSSTSCSAADATASLTPSVADSIRPSERTRINVGPGADGPQPIRTGPDEKRRLLLPAADLDSGVRQEAHALGRELAACPAVARAQRVGPVNEEEEEEHEVHEGQGGSLSDLADRLFGDLAWQEELAEERAESAETRTPSSPKAASSQDGGAPSERSEPAAEVGTGNGEAAEAPLGPPTPTSGLRLLQQRRRERREALGEQAVPEEPTAPAAAAQQPVDEGDDLVRLWMKQRW